jgi:CRP-like cAMP-binding protein
MVAGDHYKNMSDHAAPDPSRTGSPALSKDELIQYLQSHTVFSDLGSDALGVLVDHAEEKSVAAGDLLFKQDDTAENIFILIDGAIEVEVPSIMGPALVVQTLGKDDVLGWSWLIPPYRWAFEAKATQDSKVLAFDGRSLLQYCEEHTNFGYELMKRFTALMSERLHAARLKMMDNWAPPGWA